MTIRFDKHKNNYWIVPRNPHGVMADLLYNDIDLGWRHISYPTQFGVAMNVFSPIQFVGSRGLVYLVFNDTQGKVYETKAVKMTYDRRKPKYVAPLVRIHGENGIAASFVTVDCTDVLVRSGNLI